MKIRILTVLLCGFLGQAHGQTLDQFKTKINQRDSTYSSRVEVREHGDAATAVKSLQVRPSGEKIHGYRVCIFSDNSQNARPLANSSMGRFREIFPDIPTYLTYESPYFKVTVGNCLTAEEANILWGRVKDTFDRAVVVLADIPLTQFGQ